MEVIGVGNFVLKNVLLCPMLMLLHLMVSGAAAAAADPVRIVITETPEGVSVEYRLRAPVTSLALQASEVPGSITGARVLEESLSFENGRITSSRPFTQATLILLPAGREREAVFPAVLPVNGRGKVVYLPYLRPASGPSRVSLRAAGGTLRPGRREMLDGYVIVGPNPVRRAGFDVLIAADVPPFAQDLVVERSANLLAFYRSMLGKPPEKRPVIIVSQLDPIPGAAQTVFRGDVSANGVVFLRTYGAPPTPGDAASTSQYARFLSHELFHLWNRSGGLARQDAWLVEGGAEYAGWLAVSTLWPQELSLERSLNGALRTCMLYLGPRPMTGLSETQAGGVRYSCGAVINWLAHLGSGRQRDGGFQVWKRLLSRREQNGSFSAEDFLTAVTDLAPYVAPQIRSLVSGTGIGRWEEIARAANGAGAQVQVNPPAPFALKVAAAKSLVLSACGEVRGVGEQESGLLVQAPESCTVFGDSPILVQAAGKSPISDPPGFYEAVRAACSSKREVEVVVDGRTGRRSHTVRCWVPVEEPPGQIEVLQALPSPHYK